MRRSCIQESEPAFAFGDVQNYCFIFAKIRSGKREGGPEGKPVTAPRRATSDSAILGRARNVSFVVIFVVAGTFASLIHNVVQTAKTASARMKRYT